MSVTISSDNRPAQEPSAPDDDKPNVRQSGTWAHAKLGAHEDYLKGFAIASKRSPYRIYLDLFCGPGKNKAGGTIFDGSPLIALAIDPPFTHCVFVDRDPRNIATLRKHIKTEFPNQPAQIITAAGDCNQLLPGLLKQLPHDGATFAFEDPDGVNIDWRTVVALASHKGDHRWKIEQFILFQYHGLVRLLSPDKPSFQSKMVPALNAIFGKIGDKIMRSAFGQDHGGQLPLLRAPYRSMQQPLYRKVPELDRFALRTVPEDGEPS